MKILPTLGDEDTIIKIFTSLSADVQTVLEESQIDISSIKDLVDNAPLLGYKMYLIFLYLKIQHE